MKILIITLLISVTSFASTIVSAELGQSYYSSSQMKDYNTLPSGLEKYASIGILRLDLEYGIYFSSSELSAQISHDGEPATINMSTSTFGAYLNSFFGRVVLGLGLGKVTVKQEVESELSAPQERIIKKMYGLNSEFTQQEILASIGYSLWRTDYASLYVKSEIAKFDDSEKFSIRLGFKYRFN